MTDDTTPTTDGQPDDHAPPTDGGQGDHLPAAVREGLRDATTALDTTDPASGDVDLAPVGDRLADATVVGLGEATHGTREFFQVKHRILRHLVETHGVRTFAMEANLPEAMALHDYVVHGEGDPRDALAATYFWTWQTESVLAMVEWLRSFNEGRPREDRVGLYGVDSQYTHGAVERLRDHLAASDPALLAAIEDDLAAVDDDGEPPHQAEDIPEQVAAAERVLPRLRAHLDAQDESGSDHALGHLRRYVTVLEQAVDYAELVDGADDIEDDDEATRRLIAHRDRAMADNAAWFRAHEDADTLVLWAHDAHVNRLEQAHPRKDPSAPSLGHHLAERHGAEYYALGFAFGRGRFQAMHEGDDGAYVLREQHLDGPLDGTMEAALAALDEPLAVVDLRAASADDRTADWLASHREQFRTGATYDVDDPREQLVEYVYADAFDALCFVRETTRVRPLDGVEAAD